VYLPDINRVSHSSAAQYTFFSAAHGTFFKIGQILEHRTSFRKCKKIEMSPCILSDHKGIKQELNSKKNYRKYSNIWRLKKILLNVQYIIEEIERKSKSS
jgi:hypothetical protein